MTASSDRSIPWLRVFVEGVVIVGSILLAFGIDAWWARTQEKEQLHEVLAGIAGGLTDSGAGIDRHIERTSAHAAHLQRFLAMEPSEVAQIPYDSTGAYLSPVHRPYTHNLTFLRLALDNELLRSLDEPRLRAAIVDWRESVSQLEEVHQELAAHWGDALRALGKHEEVARWLAGHESGIEGNVMRRVREDPDIISLAARKSVLMSFQLYHLRRIREDEHTLLTAIQAVVSR